MRTLVAETFADMSDSRTPTATITLARAAASLGETSTVDDSAKQPSGLLSSTAALTVDGKGWGGRMTQIESTRNSMQGGLLFVS